MNYKDDQLLEEAYGQTKPIEEGILDRLKATGSGIKHGFNRAVEAGGKKPSRFGFGQDVKNITKNAVTGFKSGRSRGLIRSHVQKLNANVDDFISDMKQIAGASDESEQNFEQISLFLKGIIAKIGNKVSGDGRVTVSDLRGTLSKAGFVED